MMRRGRKMGRGGFAALASQSVLNPYGLTTLPPELYVPLWWYSGALSFATTATTSGSIFLAKGSTGTSVSTGTNVRLFTLSSSWSANIKYALECYVVTNSGAATGYIALYDFTAGTVVVSSQASVSGTGSTVIRSSQFTLTPGHQYGVTYWSSSASYQVQITDASLIVFPNQQLLAQGSLSNITLGTVGQKLTEAQIPLWVYSSGSNGASSTPTSAGTWFIQKGTLAPTVVSAGTVPTGSTVKLLSSSSSWSPSQRFALEASINANNASNTSSIALYDLSVSSNNVITASTASATGTTFTVVRSGSFTLTPGHVYAITGWCSNTTYGTVISKAHLVPLFT